MSKRIITEAEVDRHIAEQSAKMTARGRRPLPQATMRALARTHLEMTEPTITKNQSAPDSTPVASFVFGPKQHPTHERPIVLPSALVLAERERACRIISKAPADTEADAVAAVRSGMSVGEFKDVLTANAILKAGRLARGIQ